MKVLFINEHIESKSGGGDMVQMLNTKKYIESHYSDVHIQLCDSLNNEEYFKNADLIHIFNIQTADYTYKAMQIAKKHDKFVYLSTIFWDLKDATYVYMLYKVFHRIPNELSEKLRPIGNIISKVAYVFLKNKTNIMYNKKKLARLILEEADCLLPNSNEEIEIMCKTYNLNFNKMMKKTIVVPNAIDKNKINNSKNETIINIPNDYVLQVGAISPVKNQVKVVKALMNYKDIPIVFIGKSGNESYYRLLQKIAKKRGNVFLFEEIPNNKIFDFYKNAVCHILPSFRESPGLVSLEAYAMNTSIIVSNKKFCPIDYYRFNEFAIVCNPYSSKSIRESILKTIDEKVPTKNKDYFDFFSYDNVAKCTYEAYLRVLKQ